MVKNLPANAGDAEDSGWIPGKIPWRRKWQSTPVFLPGESHGQRSLVGYKSVSCKELDATEQLSTHTHTHTHTTHTHMHTHLFYIKISESATQEELVKIPVSFPQAPFWLCPSPRKCIFSQLLGASLPWDLAPSHFLLSSLCQCLPSHTLELLQPQPGWRKVAWPKDSQDEG